MGEPAGTPPPRSRPADTGETNRSATAGRAMRGTEYAEVATALGWTRVGSTGRETGVFNRDVAGAWSPDR